LLGIIRILALVPCAIRQPAERVCKAGLHNQLELLMALLNLLSSMKRELFCFVIRGCYKNVSTIPPFRDRRKPNFVIKATLMASKVSKYLSLQTPHLVRSK
jgi:hypothetical protein